jgi:hypothetical protein
MDVIQTIREGMRGRKFWCEIAAKVGVQAFAAMSWPARLIGVSRDGREWTHAVMEAWSNDFAKWFAIDTDFNVVYESGGIPLSAYELCHDGPAVQARDDLRHRLLGEPKPSLPLKDLLPFYDCICLDLRSDWYTRKLKRGSPAGGDLATWWTARPGFAPSLAPKIRIDNACRFNWPVNIAWARLDRVEVHCGRYDVRARLHAYSPHFAGFQVSVDAGGWQAIDGDAWEVSLAPGNHTLAVRVATTNGGCGVSNPLHVHLS